MKTTGFGYKCGWLAVKSSNSADVARALGLQTLRPSDWSAGIAAAYGSDGTQVFVTPPIQGWVLAVAVAFLDLTDGPDPPFATFITRLSAELGTEVQYFATHRVVEAHAWGRAVQGELRRAYEYVGESGETVIDVGPLSTEERELGLDFSNPNCTDAEGTDESDETEASWPDEESVMQLAGRWSIGPEQLEEDSLELAEGLVGEIDLSPFAVAGHSAWPDPGDDSEFNSDDDQPRSPVAWIRIWNWLRRRFRGGLPRTASTRDTVDSYFESYKHTLEASPYALSTRQSVGKPPERQLRPARSNWGTKCGQRTAVAESSWGTQRTRSTRSFRTASCSDSYPSHTTSAWKMRVRIEANWGFRTIRKRDRDQRPSLRCDLGCRISPRLGNAVKDFRQRVWM